VIGRCVFCHNMGPAPLVGALLAVGEGTPASRLARRNGFAAAVRGIRPSASSPPATACGLEEVGYPPPEQFGRPAPAVRPHLSAPSPAPGQERAV